MKPKHTLFLLAIIGFFLIQLQLTVQMNITLANAGTSLDKFITGIW